MARSGATSACCIDAGRRVSNVEGLGSPPVQQPLEAVVDKEQQDRFKDAVEPKARASEAAARKSQDGSADSAADVEGDQASLRSASEPQGMSSSRAKNSRHGKVTADTWNQ
jgi:hypothetical protein